MSAQAPRARFRVNPVELLILLGVMGLFGNSVYKLFYGWDEIKTAALDPLLNPPTGVSPTVEKSFSYVRLDCVGENGSIRTTASKVRLSGPNCIPVSGRTPASNFTSDEVAKTEIANQANRISAAVSNISNGEFSSDYLPLNLGKNPIEIKFQLKDGTFRTRVIELIRE